MKRDKTSFTFAGYSPSDGLGEGRWVPRPGSAGVQDWVGQLERSNAEREPIVGQCFDCDRAIHRRAIRCQPCNTRHRHAKRAA